MTITRFRIRRIRKRLGLRLETVGPLSGHSAATISRIENGLLPSRPEQMSRIMRTLQDVERVKSMYPGVAIDMRNTKWLRAKVLELRSKAA
jgi:predicted transcriptional regulator